MNMVTTVDGKTAVGGKASGIGTTADRAVMRTLRSKADAVMIGGGTLRAERLSLSLDADDPRPRPLAVILTGTGEVPLQRNLVRDGRQGVLIILGESADEGVEGRLGGLAEVRRVPNSESGFVDLKESLGMLRSQYKVDRLLVEGGPTLNRALVSADLADELFLPLAPTLLGADAPQAPAILDGALPEPRKLRLLSAYLARGELFLRYALGGTRG
jgi:riboflavin biosynthesis pyrimidine reductase